MREIDLSDVAGIWFHEVQISRVSIDYIKRGVEFECVIPVGWWNTPNRQGLTTGEIKGVLHLTGLLYLTIEPPDATYPYEDSIGIEITDEGSVTAEKFETYLSKIPHDLPEEAFLHYFFVSELNAYIFVAATGAQFH